MIGPGLGLEGDPEMQAPAANGSGQGGIFGQTSGSGQGGIFGQMDGSGGQGTQGGIFGGTGSWLARQRLWAFGSPVLLGRLQHYSAPAGAARPREALHCLRVATHSKTGR